jgi:hypothetical protein
MKDQAPEATSIKSFGVAYFDCVVPPALKGCCNGSKDGTETDVDCGGPLGLGDGTCDRCQDGQACISDSDCVSPFQCTVDTMTGLKNCVGGALTASICDPDTGTGGAGGAGGVGGAGGMGGAGGAGGAGGN